MFFFKAEESPITAASSCSQFDHIMISSKMYYDDTTAILLYMHFTCKHAPCYFYSLKAIFYLYSFKITFSGPTVSSRLHSVIAPNRCTNHIPTAIIVRPVREHLLTYYHIPPLISKVSVANPAYTIRRCNSRNSRT